MSKKTPTAPTSAQHDGIAEIISNIRSQHSDGLPLACLTMAQATRLADAYEELRAGNWQEGFHTAMATVMRLERENAELRAVIQRP